MVGDAWPWGAVGSGGQRWVALKQVLEGYRYLLVEIDCSSKWVVVHPLRTKSAEEISYWFYRQFLP